MFGTKIIEIARTRHFQYIDPTDVEVKKTFIYEQKRVVSTLRSLLLNEKTDSMGCFDSRAISMCVEDVGIQNPSTAHRDVPRHALYTTSPRVRTERTKMPTTLLKANLRRTRLIVLKCFQRGLTGSSSL